MAFLKLGDLINRGHPVTVGDDGTVFTRLHMGQLADVTHQAITPEEKCVEKRSEGFLSLSSFTSNALANEDELTVIYFEELSRADQKYVCQQGFRSEKPGIANIQIPDTCTEISLLVIKSEGQTEREQYPREELFTTDLVVEHEDNVFVSKQSVKIADVTGDENCGKGYESVAALASYSIGEPHPEDSRVLFNIGNLSVGHIPAHPGFIKLTTPNDGILGTQDECQEETCHATNAEKEKIGYSASGSSSATLATYEMLIDPELIIKTGKQEGSYDSKAGILTENDRGYQPTDLKSKPRLHITKQKCPDLDCNEIFPLLPSAKRNCPNVNSETKAFFCTFPGCGVAFRFASYLSRHVQAKHNGVRNHKCVDCDRRFVTARDLAVHERTHTGDKPVCCLLAGCGLMFSTRSIADNHYLGTHTGVKPFQCEVCGKLFTSSSNLIDHRLVHLGIRKFICPVSGCGKAFLAKGKLKRHNLTHNLKPFGCKECDRRYRQHSALKTHVKKIHAVKDQKE